MNKPDQQQKTIKLIIGLGNPSAPYYKNRHSIGFRVLDTLASEYHASWQHKELMDVATITIHDHHITLVKPLTFMNASGKVIPFFLKKGVHPAEIIVVHDELEIPFGQIKTRIGGSHRGHNGLRSIIDACGANFLRIRFGISRPERKEDVPHYVLQNFSPNEEQQLYQYIEKAIELITDICV